MIFLGLAVQSWAQIGEMKNFPTSTSQEIIAKSGIKGGLVVHLGQGDAAFTTGFFLNDSFLVHGLYRNEAAVAQGRAHIKKNDL
jgi:hypothetical protein